MAGILRSKLAPVAPKKAATRAAKAVPISSVSICGPKGAERSVSIRKIANGFVVRESTYGPKGYKEVETFSPKAPRIDVAQMTKTRK